MGYRIFAAVLGALLISLTGQAASATPILGTPTCDGAGNCEVSLSGATSFAATTTVPYAITVALDSPYHIELIDTDELVETVNLLFATGLLHPDGTNDVQFGVDIEFLDMDGNIVGGSGYSSSFTLNGPRRFSGAQSCGGCGTTGAGGSFLFHGFNLTVTPSQDANISVLSGVQFHNFDSTSNVGVWEVPEPGTLAIFGMGLLGLGAMRRRKRST